MTSDQLSLFYEKRKTGFTALRLKIRKQINLISNLRLATALIFLAILYFVFSYTVLFYVEVVLLIIFIFCIQKHARLFKQKTHLENLVKINEQELAALAGNFSVFPNGAAFIDPHHPYTHDLDIFGEGSLFQAINRCNTISGEKQMAAGLSVPMTSAEEILSHQQAIQELVPKTDFRQHFQAAGMEMQEQPHDREQLLEWLRQPSFLYGKPFYKIILWVIPSITVLLVVATFFFSAVKPFAILLALSQWAFLGTHIKKINAFHDYISRKKNILEKYAYLLHYLQQEKFSSARLQKLFGQAHEADRKVRSLASLVSALDARLNAMTTLVVNSLLLYDFQYVYRLERWKHENAASLKTWLDVVSEVEVLNSFSTFSFNNPRFTYARFNTSLNITAQQLGHPLLAESECITNDLFMGNGQSVLIVTGANMAGKSTFLRTLGINLVLALNGAPVCAASFACPVINLRTGMRTADSLKDHQSYFYAELERLKTIMDELRSNKPLLILLDEILKGTNSTDKQSGSIALVKQLLPHPCLAIIATHDLALGDLEKEYPNHIKNFCFEATIENDQLSFDYKLKPGLAQKMNATFLMKKMGIIPA